MTEQIWLRVGFNGLILATLEVDIGLSPARPLQAVNAS
jgi:hypothetical protein